jgi:AcrR family transcriptional regulator
VDREQLLGTAAELFFQRGYRGASLEELAARLGVKKASLYYYIDSKEDLLLEICERRLDAIESRIHPIAESRVSPDECLRRMIHAYVDLALQDTYFRTAVHRIYDLDDTNRLTVLRRFRELERYFERVIVSGQQRNLFKPVDPRLAVLAILGMCDAIPIWGQFVKFPGAQIAAEFCLMLESGIHVDGSSRTGSWPRADSVGDALGDVAERVELLRRDARALSDEVDRARQRLEEGLASE